jgi:hypothetical protein
MIKKGKPFLYLCIFILEAKRIRENLSISKSKLPKAQEQFVRAIIVINSAQGRRAYLAKGASVFTLEIV